MSSRTSTTSTTRTGSDPVRPVRPVVGLDEAPGLPSGRHVDLGPRGTTFVRELTGPVGAPTVVLLHGWTATADLNWSATFHRLAEHFHVVALDHHGHGRGVRRDESFELAACADDVAALARTLGLRDVIVAGYSMGGPIAQLTWRRHRSLVAGVVLCATADVFADTTAERRMFTALDRLADAARIPLLRRSVERVLRGLAAAKARTRVPGAWALEQIARHDWLTVLDAGRSLGRHDARCWLPGLDVPAAVVITTSDEVVPAERQRAMAASLADVSLHEIDAGHAACYDAVHFVPAVVAACRSVAARMTSAASASSAQGPCLIPA